MSEESWVFWNIWKFLKLTDNFSWKIVRLDFLKNKKLDRNVNANVNVSGNRPEEETIAQ